MKMKNNAKIGVASVSAIASACAAKARDPRLSPEERAVAKELLRLWINYCKNNELGHLVIDH